MKDSYEPLLERCLTALTLEQLRESIITIFHSPKSSLENPNYSHRAGYLFLLPCPMVSWTSVKGTGSSMKKLVRKDASTSAWMSSSDTTKIKASGNDILFQAVPYAIYAKERQGQSKTCKGKSKGRQARRFFRPCRKSSGKGNCCKRANRPTPTMWPKQNRRVPERRHK